MTVRGARFQRGVALIALLAVIALAASWFLVKQLNTESGAVSAERKNRNAEVLNRAKQALIGYVAMKAAESGERNPGRLPCPEGVSYVGVPANEGIAWSGFGTNCVSVGRLPWRTLGLDKLLDASSEPLWYVVGPTWRLSSSASTLTINSNTTGDLSVDAQNVVALIIAPGPAMNAQAATGCTAKNQVRSTPSPTIDATNYLECFDATALQFTTTASSSSYNDQVVRITVADIMPGIEAAIAYRIEREVAPSMQTMYAGTSWNLSASSRQYPFAAQFDDPSTSLMQGLSANLQGLLPMTYAETYPGSGVLCTEGASAPRCAQSFVSWTSASISGASVGSGSCTVTATQLSCSFYYSCLLFSCGASTIPFTVNATASNVGRAMRQLNAGASMTNVASASLSATFATNGDASLVLSGTAKESATDSWVLNALCGLGVFEALLGCKQTSITIPITVFADHPLLDTRTAGASTSWFARNNWQDLTYYALAAGYAPGSAAACTTGSTCLSVTNVSPVGAQRAILILAGRSINDSSRPSTALGDYLESGNATAAYTRNSVNGSVTVPVAQRFNDRIIVIDSN